VRQGADSLVSSISTGCPAVRERSTFCAFSAICSRVVSMADTSPSQPLVRAFGEESMGVGFDLLQAREFIGIHAHHGATYAGLTEMILAVGSCARGWRPASTKSAAC
jgi:hypothetical protein